MADTAAPPEAAEPGTAPAAPRPASPAVVVKKYANRRLYNTETSSYVTLEDLAGMVRAGRDFTVHDAKSGEDISRAVLTQIIVEEESKGRSLLPESFLRHLIGFYGDSLQTVLPRYLELAMAGFARQQEQMRRSVEQTMVLPFSGLEEMGKQQKAMMERAMSLFSPFRPPEAPPAAAQGPTVEDLQAEVQALKQQIETLRAAGARPKR